MSGNDENDSSPLNAYSYCKDYLRGCCTREQCRHRHERPPKAYMKEIFRFCHDFQNKGCYRANCKFIHRSCEEEEHFHRTGVFPRDQRPLPVCQAYIQGTCYNQECKFFHPPDNVTNGNQMPVRQNPTTHQFNGPPPTNFREEDSPSEPKFRRFVYEDKQILPDKVTNGNQMPVRQNPPPPQFNGPPPNFRTEDSPPEPKCRRFTYEDTQIILPPANICHNCETVEHKNKLLHENISVLLQKISDLSEKNAQLTSMNEFLLEQTASVRGDQPCLITSRHCTTAPVSLATVSVTPVVSLTGIPTLMPAAATPNLTLAPASSRAQLLTPAPQLLTVSTTQQLVGNSGALIVTSAGQQLMQVSDSGTLMGGGQTVVAVTPAQLTLAPQAQQLISSAPQNAVQQLVQQSALQTQLGPQHQATQYATQQSMQHLTANQSQHLQQSAQHLAAAQQSYEQSAQHLAQQSAQHLVQQHAAQSAQHLAQQTALAAQQSAQRLAQQNQHLAQQNQQLAQQNQQLVHQSSTQITISSNSQPMALPNSQAQTITFPIISQSILPH